MSGRLVPTELLRRIAMQLREFEKPIVPPIERDLVDTCDYNDPHDRRVAAYWLRIFETYRLSSRTPLP